MVLHDEIPIPLVGRPYVRQTRTLANEFFSGVVVFLAYIALRCQVSVQSGHEGPFGICLSPKPKIFSDFRNDLNELIDAASGFFRCFSQERSPIRARMGFIIMGSRASHSQAPGANPLGKALPILRGTLRQYVGLLHRVDDGKPFRQVDAIGKCSPGCRQEWAGAKQTPGAERLRSRETHSPAHRKPVPWGDRRPSKSTVYGGQGPPVQESSTPK